MGEKSMVTRNWVYGLAVAWLVVTAVAYYMLATVVSDGTGFTSGVTRVQAMLGWQLIAFVPALAGFVALMQAAKPHESLLRLAGYGPIALMLVQAVVVGGYLLSTGGAAPAL
ncbi:hypothetical protein [Iodidimonas sp. SYSU 1G8]|uniref:hypothetical protein n=1 Tax=Iodidimonas sp. SYSU 1G8 TaxID=3133967 RepID=UPI0031FEA055